MFNQSCGNQQGCSCQMNSMMSDCGMDNAQMAGGFNGCLLYTSVILSIIGSLLGTVFGYLLHRFIIRTVELDVTMFVRSLNFTSYIFAIIITLGFTLFIDFVMRRVLNRVNMVESLKSIE